MTWIEDNGVLATLALTVVLAALGLWGTRRWGTRRSRLRVSWDFVGVIPPHPAKNLEIRLDGKVMEDPYVLTVIMRNAGPNDIAESNFNRTKPLRVTVMGARIIDIMDQEDEDLPHRMSDDGADLLVGPGLLPAKSQRTFYAFTDQKPSGIDVGKLVDVDIKSDGVPIFGDDAKGLREATRSQLFIAVLATSGFALFLLDTILKAVNGR